MIAKLFFIVLVMNTNLLYLAGFIHLPSPSVGWKSRKHYALALWSSIEERPELSLFRGLFGVRDLYLSTSCCSEATPTRVTALAVRRCLFVYWERGSTATGQLGNLVALLLQWSACGQKTVPSYLLLSVGDDHVRTIRPHRK